MALSDTLKRGLQGFASGMAGRGDEYIEDLNDQRKEAMAKDALQVQQLLSSGDLEGAVGLLTNRDELIGKLGGDSSDTRALMAKIQSGDAKGALNDAQTFTMAARNAGYLPQIQTKIDERTGQLLQYDPATGKTSVSKIEGYSGLEPIPSVKSSEILGDGTVVMAMADGSTTVVDAEGNKLSGKARVKAIKNAREFEAENQRQRAEGRTLGTDPIKVSIDLGRQAFEKIDGINKNIANLDAVVAAIDKGAGTGAFERYFPSIKAASIELDNLRNRLGLDIVGDVTFGALSEGELQLALDTALPTGLNSAELKQWALDKKVAQQKYTRELEKAASFFSRGGNIADYIAIRKEQASTAPTGSDTQNASGAAPGQSRSEEDILSQYGVN